MKLDKIFGFLVPKEHKFMDLFNNVADNMVDTSELLIKLIRESNLDKRTEYIKAIRDAEHKGDDYTRLLMSELNGTFITPFDREDIHEMIGTMDNVVDYIHTASKRIHFYKMATFPEAFIKIADLIHMSTKEIQRVMRGVRHATDFQKFKDACENIHTYESRVDDIYQEFLSVLFEEEVNAIELIKKRDILVSLEKAIDTCDDVANVFAGIMVKIS